VDHSARTFFLNESLWRNVVHRVFLALLLIPIVAAKAPADLPSPSNDPYQLAVCLRFSEDLIFTPFFRASVERQVRDQLANYFGPLADVQVVAEHPLLAKWGSDSLADLSLSHADFAAEASRQKVFLTAVAFRDGLYQIEWRQADGDVERLGPLYRQGTPDRQWLVKAICTAVRRDFAPVARIEIDGDRSSVRLDFRGADLGGPLASWLEDGCVLGPFWVVQQQDGSLASMPIPHTVLKIQEGSDWKQAEVVTGLADPWKRTARVAGFRAIKLTTQSGRFRLRLLSSEDDSPVQNCNVYASSKGFEETADTVDLASPDREGYVVAAREFQDLAYITVKRNRAYKLLVPITQDWCELELRLPADERSGRRSDWQRQLNYCVQDIQILQVVVDQCIRDVNDLNQNKRYEEAVKRVESAVDSLRPKIVAAQRSVGDVSAEAAELQTSGNSLLAWARDQVDQLRQRQSQLEELAGDLNDTIDKIDAQSRASVLLKLAGEAEHAGDIDDAIAKYDLALQEWPDQPQIRQHVDQLRRDWQTKGPEHVEARRLVFETYAAAGADQLDSLLGEAKNAFRVLTGVDDYLTMMKLSRVNQQFIAELTEIVELLTTRGGEADRAEREQYERLLDDVLNFQEQIIGYGTAREGKKPPAAATEPSPPTDETPPGGGVEPDRGGQTAPPSGQPGPPPLEGEEEEPPLKP